MNRRVYLATVGSAAVAGIAGCTALGDVGDEFFGSEEYDIGMSRNEFLPEKYEASVGEAVVWKNTSEADHTVTALGGGIPDDAAYFASGGYEDYETATEEWWDHHGGRIGTRSTFEHTFEVVGTYDYVCVPHAGGGMIGQVTVTE